LLRAFSLAGQIEGSRRNTFKDHFVCCVCFLGMGEWLKVLQ